MNQLKTYKQPEILQPPTKADKEKAHQLHQNIITTITSVHKSETELSRNYVELGRDIYEVQKNLYWSILGYGSWKEYFTFLEDKFGKGRSQLYGYTSTVRTLSEYVDDQTLLDMGINKAGELRKAVVATSQAPSEEILEKARDPKMTVPEFREAVHKAFHVTDHNEKGTWRDMKGIYAADEEWNEILHGFDLAIKTDPQIPKALPAHTQMKEILLKLVREFISEYEWKVNQNSDEAAKIEWAGNEP